LAELDIQEMKMFAKWYGTAGLASNREFWHDCMAAYVDKCVTLPMYDELAEREGVLKLVKCPPGECGACCKYDKVAITQKEYNAILANTHSSINIISDDKGNLFLDSSKNCQFLINRICTIYSYRPSVCRSFPIITSKEAVAADGTPVKQIQVRLKCRPCLDAVCEIFTRVCATGKLILLPDLSLIPAYEEGEGVLGRI
jgi:Fe-S-cluster containining protein